MHIVDINNIEELDNFNDLPFTSLMEWKYPYNNHYRNHHRHHNHHHRHHHNHHNHHNHHKNHQTQEFSLEQVHHPKTYYSHEYSDIYNRLSNCTSIKKCLYVSNCLVCSDIASFFLLTFIFCLICISCRPNKKISKKVIMVKEPDIKEIESGIKSDIPDTPRQQAELQWGKPPHPHTPDSKRNCRQQAELQ